jgi:hypothetical protein
MNTIDRISTTEPKMTRAYPCSAGRQPRGCIRPGPPRRRRGLAEFGSLLLMHALTRLSAIRERLSSLTPGQLDRHPRDPAS